jgi:hypothetical protein
LICERTLSSRLAIYLQEAFKDYNVDCEYNRHINDIKNINGKKIYPDIIIHKRKNDDDNLVWIEVKKEDSDTVQMNEDRERLNFVTSSNEQYKYKLGVFIIFSQNKRDLVIEYYVNGQKLECD